MYERWRRKFRQAVKWKFCANEARNTCYGSREDKTYQKEPYNGIQGKGCIGCNQGEKTLAELSTPCDVHVNQITQWKSKLITRSTEIFATAAERNEAAGPDVGSLHAKIGQQAMEIDFLAVALGRMDAASAKK